ncbi:hypothetical protein KFZ58_14685 [Virgibacillus sp. NKC19-16]|uniref:hypothetical protein n=1 Tax=Virgibacillus salidurans TaxID=2831673 RepID=UPI001F1F22E5|nr:hypothetical protein [Virgibacillus sp. NKC19-16]UJL45628.1 hypothetical protein KFZ58_14685 [Virgibacillus sp. NKC19-16]
MKGCIIIAENELELNLNLEDIKLVNLSTERKKNGGKIDRKNNIEILEFNKERNQIAVEYTENVTGALDLNLTIEAIFSVEAEKDLTATQLEEIVKKGDIDHLAYPLLTESTQITSFITGKVQGIPTIFPPMLEDKADKDK